MPIVRHSLLYSLYLFLHFSVAIAAAYLKLPLLHTSPYPPTPSEAFTADKCRLSSLKKRPHPQLPVISAASSGSGQYLVAVHLGTPPQRLLLVADTGSDLTWVSCSRCHHCNSRAAEFFPRLSDSFSPYHCYSSKCKMVPHSEKPSRCNRTRSHSSCRYEYSYSDGSATRGLFSHETMTFSTSADKLDKFHGLSFGCGFWNDGPSVSGPSFKGASGVLGLGRGPISFSSQLGGVFGHKFSYCLLDFTLSPPPTSYLLIGGGSANSTATAAVRLSFTNLLTNPLSPTFYYIQIVSIFINNVKLRISPSTWAIDELGNGGTVLDSGTTLTYLAEPAYTKIVAEFKRLVEPINSAQPSSGFDFCLNFSSSDDATLPQVSFKLGGGSEFIPPPRNYFIDIAEGFTCLALRPVASSSSFSVIGNLMQQGFTFEFDKESSRVGFTRSGCGSP